MSTVQKYTLTLYTVDVDGIAADQKITAPAAMLLNGIESSGGTWTSPDGYAHQIALESSADIQTAVFTVVGTDSNGAAQTETITGINNSAVESTKYYKTITSITPDISVASNVHAGLVDEAVTKAYPLSEKGSGHITYQVTVSGTASVSFQGTLDDPQLVTVPNWVTLTSGSALTASTLLAFQGPLAAARLMVNSYSSGAVVTFFVSQTLK